MLLLEKICIRYKIYIFAEIEISNLGYRNFIEKIKLFISFTIYTYIISK